MSVILSGQGHGRQGLRRGCAAPKALRRQQPRSETFRDWSPRYSGRVFDAARGRPDVLRKTLWLPKPLVYRFKLARSATSPGYQEEKGFHRSISPEKPGFTRPLPEVKRRSQWDCSGPAHQSMIRSSPTGKRQDRHHETSGKAGRLGMSGDSGGASIAGCRPACTRIRRPPARRDAPMGARPPAAGRARCRTRSPCRPPAGAASAAHLPHSATVAREHRDPAVIVAGRAAPLLDWLPLHVLRWRRALARASDKSRVVGDSVDLAARSGTAAPLLAEGLACPSRAIAPRGCGAPREVLNVMIDGVILQQAPEPSSRQQRAGRFRLSRNPRQTTSTTTSCVRRARQAEQAAYRAVQEAAAAASA